MSSAEICSRCVMDTSEKIIDFDENGHCCYCREAIKRLEAGEWNRHGEAELKAVFDRMKAECSGRKYDCIIGISGGVDSSYVAYIAHRYGVRMLGVHVAAGWNTPVSENNIRKLCEKYGVDLVVEKVPLDEMMDLQRAYFISGVPNQDVPQDHAFFAVLYRYAIEHGITWILEGRNFSSESILGRGLRFDPKDSVNLLDIHAKFGKIPLKKFPIMDEKTFYEDIPRKKQFQVFSPLDLIDYNKFEAIKILHADCGFEYYGGKHLESRFTKLYQNYILPQKFHCDKRRAHLSSLIVAGQLSREDALAELARPPYGDPAELEMDIRYFIDKVGLTREEFDRIMQEEPREHTDFKVNKYYRRSKLLKNPWVRFVLSVPGIGWGKRILKRWF